MVCCRKVAARSVGCGILQKGGSLECRLWCVAKRWQLEVKAVVCCRKVAARSVGCGVLQKGGSSECRLGCVAERWQLGV